MSESAATHQEWSNDVLGERGKQCVGVLDNIEFFFFFVEVVHHLLKGVEVSA